MTTEKSGLCQYAVRFTQHTTLLKHIWKHFPHDQIKKAISMTRDDAD